MHREIRTLDGLDLLEMWKRPNAGELAPSIQWMVGVACVISVLAAALGARAVWHWTWNHSLQNAFAYALGGWLIATAIPPSRVSRLMRAAVMLPIGHVVVVVLAWVCFAAYREDISSKHFSMSIYDEFPMAAALAVFAIASIAVAVIVARRRAERLHALVTMTLIHLLVLGLWLPIASAIAVGQRTHLDFDDGMRATGWRHNDLLVWKGDVVSGQPAWFVIALVPAFIVAALVTASVMRRPEWARNQRGAAIASAIMMTLVATAARLEARPDAVTVHGSFVHVVLALLVLAVLALVALGIASCRRVRADERTRIAGTIADAGDGNIAGHFELSSWLRGPRALVRPCIVTTALGDIPIPRGATLDASISPATSALVVGESAVVLRTGDRVIVGGLVEQTTEGHPFRTAATLALGPTATIAPIDDRYGFANAVLALWRPCIAYLAILTAIAIPTLIAVLK